MLNRITELLDTSPSNQRMKELLKQEKILLLDRPALPVHQHNAEKYEAIMFPLDCFIIFAVRGKHQSLCLKCLIARLKANPPYPLTQNTIANLVRLSNSGDSYGYPEQPAFINNLIVSLLKDLLDKPEQSTIISLNLVTSDIYSVLLIPLHGCPCRGDESIAGKTRFVDELLNEFGEYNETV